MKNRKKRYVNPRWRKNYYVAIVFRADGSALKYNNIHFAEPGVLEKFEQFARSVGGIRVNYYLTWSGKFDHQKKLV